MNSEEIRADLDHFLKAYYKDTYIVYLDVPNKILEIQLKISDFERKYVRLFYGDNRKIFTEATEKTDKDLNTIDSVFLRIDEDGVFFGKSDFDVSASNAAAYYLLSRYLEEMMDLLPERLEQYRQQILLN